MALSVMATAVLSSVVFPGLPSRAQSSPPSFIGEEMRHVQKDFAAGGIRRLSASWYSCIDEARNSLDANGAERCVVYGYGALLFSDQDPSGRMPEVRHLTADILAPGQTEMLEIMGIPEGPRQAWLNRYQRWMVETFHQDSGVRDAGAADTGGSGGGTSYGAYGRGDREGQTDLARSADGKYPREALREPGIADALRLLVGQPLFSRLKDYSSGSPMEFTGQYTTGAACEPRACGVSEARYVFSADDTWIAIIDGGRMRIYGNPPRPVRTFLLRGANQTAWRGAVEEVIHPVAAPVIQASADPDIGGRPPRMLITPRPIPVSTDQAPRPDGATTEIRLRSHAGNLEVPVTINGAITLPFAIDSGATDVSVSSGVLEKLIQSGTVTRADFLGKQVYHLADGSAVASETFRIHALRVGDREVRDVLASVSNDGDTLLLGQSFLTRFRSWSIDNQRQVLLLK
jgi:clan AA aspartic protease (TIGR02281 family)